MTSAPSPAELLGSPITICVLQGGDARDVVVTYGPQTRDTVYQGRRFSEVFPLDSGYAGAARWYLDNEPILFEGRPYIKYGLPRVLRPLEIEPAGTFNGVVVFRESGSRGVAEYLYVPVRPGCEFQPYQGGVDTGPVKG